MAIESNFETSLNHHFYLLHNPNITKKVDTQNKVNSLREAKITRSQSDSSNTHRPLPRSYTDFKSEVTASSHTISTIQEEDQSSKAVVNSPEMLHILERFTKRKISQGIGSAQVIVKLFIQKELLSCCGITAMIKKSKEPLLKNWAQISDANEFVGNVLGLNETHREKLFFCIGGKEIFTDLKKSMSKSNRKFWGLHVQALIDYYTKVSAVTAECVFLRSYFDWKQPIASIKRQNILSTFEWMYSDSFIEETHFFTINDTWVPCPNWKEPWLNQLSPRQRKVYFLEWLIGNIYKEFLMQKDNTAAKHAALICRSPLTKKEISFLTHALDQSLNAVQLKSHEDLCFVVNKLTQYAVIRPFDICSAFSEWAKEKLGDLLVLEKLNATCIVETFISHQNFPLTKEEALRLTEIIGQVLQKLQGNLINFPNNITRELESYTMKYVALGKQFYVWAKTQLKEAVEVKGPFALLIVERYSHALWYKACHRLPCFHILQAISFSAYAHAYKLLRKKYPQLFKAEAGELCLQNFSQDNTVWRIQIKQHFASIEQVKHTFSVTHVKPYRVVVKDKEAIGDAEYQHYGKVDVCWTLDGDVTEPVFEAQLQLSNLELFDSVSLEKRNNFLALL